MLLKKKQNHSVDSEWAIILDRSPSEFSKNHALGKLAEVFSLSSEEARDLIDNTPIILLDHLPFHLADKIKAHFSQANVSCSLTSDTFTKRKCFRAVWPEQPNLAYFLQGNTSDLNGDLGHAPASSIQNVSSESKSEKSVLNQDFPKLVPDEQEQLKELTADLNKENELLRIQLEKAKDASKEREQKQLSAELEQLRSERAQLEEAMMRLKTDNRGLVLKVEELERDIKKLKETGNSEAVLFAKSQFTELKAQLEHFRSEYMRAQGSIRLAQSETKKFQSELAQTQEAFLEARKEIEDLRRLLNQVQANSSELKEETERVRFEIESQFQVQSAELEEWKRKANDWSASYFKVIKENEFLRASQSEELESLRIRNQQLSGQLEQAQKQIRDSTAQLEQQELIQKRMKTTSDLAEREAKLKTLVQKQQTLETEIRLREEEMRKVFGEQEIIEQEIVNAKQAQKYLMEQAKLKEKPRFPRPKIASPDISPRQDPGSIAPTID